MPSGPCPRILSSALMEPSVRPMDTAHGHWLAPPHSPPGRLPRRRQISHRRLLRVPAAAPRRLEAVRRPLARRPDLFDADDPFGWQVNEFEEELRAAAGPAPGRPASARQAGSACSTATRTPGCRGPPARESRTGRPNWPASRSCRTSAASSCCRWPCRAPRTTRAASAGRCSAAASRGRAGPFWRSFFTAPESSDRPRRAGVLLPAAARGLRRRRSTEPTGCRGPASASCRTTSRRFPWWSEGAAAWAEPFLLATRPRSRRQVPAHVPPVRPAARGGAEGVPRRPAVPAAVPRQPGLLGGRRRTGSSASELPLAMQIPLLHAVDPARVADRLPRPAGGLLPRAERRPARRRASTPAPAEHLPPDAPLGQGPPRPGRPGRWPARRTTLLHVLFSTIPDDLDLYDKPMARNVQLWTRATPSCCSTARTPRRRTSSARMRTVEAGGLFGYRFLFPAMRVGRHEVYWHRPLVAYRDAAGRSRGPAGRAARLPDRLRRRPAAAGPGRRTVAALAAPTGRCRRRSSRCTTPRNGRVPPRRSATSASSPTPTRCSAASRCRVSFARRSQLALAARRRSTAGSARCPDAASRPAVARAGRAARRPRRAGEARPCPGLADLLARRPRAVVRGRLLEDDRRRWPRARSSTRTTPTACATTARSGVLPYHGRHLEPLGDYLLGLLRAEDRGGEDDRQGAGRRPAVPLADRLRLPVDGRLAEEPGRPRPSATSSS